MAQKAAAGRPVRDPVRPIETVCPHAQRGEGARRQSNGSDQRRDESERLVQAPRRPKQRPGSYLSRGDGRHYEDIPQAQPAAREGADVIAGSGRPGSRADDVPEGANREGSTGRTPSRAKLPPDAGGADESSKELRPHVRRPTMRPAWHARDRGAAGMERLDMSSTESMYAHPVPRHQPDRTSSTQAASRSQIHDRAGDHHHTGEDTLLTTADAVEAAPHRDRVKLLNEITSPRGLSGRLAARNGQASRDQSRPVRVVRLELAHALPPASCSRRAAQWSRRPNTWTRRPSSAHPARTDLQPLRHHDGQASARRHDDRGRRDAVASDRDVAPQKLRYV